MSKVPDAVQKHLAALAAEAAEKAVASRMAAAPAPAAAVVAIKSAELTPAQRIGLRLQKNYVDRFGDNDPKLKAEAKSVIVQKAGALAGTAGQGGSLLPVEYSDDFIGVLRDQSVLLQAGVRLYRYSQQLNIGRLNAGAVAQFVTEGQPVTGSTLNTDAVILGSKKVAAFITASNDMLRNPHIDAAGMLGQDVVAAIAAEMDKQFILGSGTGANPTGFTGQLAAGQTFAANATVNITNIAKDLDKAERLVRQSKLPFQGNAPGWVMDSKTLMNLKGLRDNAGWVYRAELDQGRLNGYPVYVTEAIDSANILIFGLFSQVGYGVARELELTVGLNGTDLTADATTIYGTTGGDCKVRYNSCASVITGVDAWNPA